MTSGDVHHVIRIEERGAKPRLADLVIDRYAVGRAREMDGVPIDFRIPDDSAVSRLHCTLVREAEGYALENHSANGTLVDGELIEKRALLADGATIKIGERVTLTLHAYSTAERADAFAALAHASDGERPAGEEEPKSFFQRPIFVFIVLFYLGCGAMALVLMNQGPSASSSRDPGAEQEYFAWLLTEPLGPSTGTVENRRERAEKMWEETKKKHGGDLVGVGGHDYQVLIRARWILRSLGYRTVQEALDAGEPIAADLVRRKGELEDRLSDLYKEAQDHLRRGRKDEARTVFMRLKMAVPNSDENLRRYAVDQLRRLGTKRGR